MSDDIHISNAAITTTPAGSATVILLDTTALRTGTTLTDRRSFSMIKRALARIMMDQNATFFHDSLNVGSTTWRTINGSGSGQTITANTLFELDCLFIGDDTRLRVLTATVPTLWEVSVRMSTDRALAQ